MKIFIPIHRKTGDELRYTLRGIEQHATGHSGIVVIGEPPQWLTNVEIVPIIDASNNPYLNVFAKCLYMQEDFILFNDDMFLTQNTDLSTRPNVYFNDLPWRQSEAVGYSDYYKQLGNTTNFCARHFRKLANFEVHQPMKIERKALEFMRGNEQQAFLIRSISGNFSEKYDKQPNYDVHFASSKVITKIPDLKQHCKKTGIFSVGTNFLDRKGRKFLREMYPYKSKFEK